MNTNTLPKFIGVLASFIVIWFVTKFTVVDSCLDLGGKFDYSTGQCILENGDAVKLGFETPMVILYVIIGFGVTLIVSRLLTPKSAKNNNSEESPKA